MLLEISIKEKDGLRQSCTNRLTLSHVCLVSQSKGFPFNFKCGRRAWQLTPVFLPGEAQGQRGLAGYSPGDRKEVDRAEVT